MEDQQVLTPEAKTESGYDPFEIQAEFGITKHMGGVDATDILAKQCRIGVSSHVLDAGCGVGITPISLAKQYGCTVVGVDIRDSMIARARERAQKQQMADKVQFRVADVQALPFEDNQFDAVISESVLAFPEDKLRAVAEYVRVTKPGGYVGLNETIWIKPPTPELLEYLAHAGSQTQLLKHEDMQALLRANGLEVVLAQAYEISPRQEARAQIKRVGWGHILGSWWRALKMYVTKPAYRAYLQDALGTPKEAAGYVGYGLYVGRK